ncbi:hypothetical protein LN42_01875 [Marinitoga sp. 1137]|uniref:hypothetical protein n=1 Tax=Marinitoga sp. 1137 TaxID=1545835 RepID=UPI0009508704|nr:hypothetical protein [Marinitoga sp. 1137]APT75047.1 hypothetical protein LN42_00520 [Marinitoga sp. 1137]APT75277.1 hypothetical protein LN42_01875 [Marinitoga sp. 1137]
MTIIVFVVGVFVGFSISAILASAHESDAYSEAMRLKIKIVDLEAENESLRRRINDLAKERAKLFTENMKLRRGKVKTIGEIEK